MIIQGGRPLFGEVEISGAKNSCLVLAFASLLTDSDCVIRRVPVLRDVDSAAELLRTLGKVVEWLEPGVMRIRSKHEKRFFADYDLVRKMRASILCLGPLLARYGEAKVSLPGGCAIGTRPIDLHLEGLKAMGAEIKLDKGFVLAKATKLQGARFVFDSVTVGGTENLMMTACLAHGETILENCAKEPEIEDLAKFLNQMGAKIEGAGSAVIRIQGVDRLGPVEYSVMPDRIEAGTFLVAGAITQGRVTVTKMIPEHLEAPIAKLIEAGFEVERQSDAVTIWGQKEFSAVDITTNPFPQFPTDLQAQFMALMTLARGTSVITESVFENRFMHIQELVRLGADITSKSRVAIVRGVTHLSAAPVMATDLRASVCLVLAGLAAQPGAETVVNRIYHLDRGYEKIEQKLASLGAQVKRI